MATVTKCDRCEKDTDVPSRGLKSRPEFETKYGETMDVTCKSCKTTWAVHIDDIRMVQGQSIFWLLPVTLVACIALWLFVRSTGWILYFSPLGIMFMVMYATDSNAQQKADDFNEVLIDPERNERKEREEIDAYWDKRKNKPGNRS